MKYSTYENSPLALFLRQFKISLDSVSQKYRNNSRDYKQSVEEAHAFMLFKAMRQLIPKIESILDLFTDGAIPGVSDLIDIGRSVMALNDYETSFRTKNYALVTTFSEKFPQIISTAVDEYRKKIDRRASFNLTHFDENSLEKIKSLIINNITINQDELFIDAHHIPGTDDRILLNKIIDCVVDVDLIRFVSQNSLDVALLSETLTAALEHNLLFNTHGIPIAHPMTYELTLLLINLLKNLPDDLGQLAPFYNPDALAMDFTSGLSGLLVKAFIKGGFKVQRSQLNEHTSEFIYVLSMGLISYTIDAQKYYKKGKSDTINYLFAELSEYFSHYSESVHVQSEIAKFNLCKEFVEQEMRRLISVFDESSPKIDAHTTFEIEEIDSLANINAMINDHESALDNIAKLQDLFNYRKNQINTLKLEQLIEQDNSLVCALQKDGQHNLDISYKTSQLPDYLISFTKRDESVVQYPIKKTLNMKLDQYLNLLKLQSQSTSQHLIQLKSRQSILSIKWRKEQLSIAETKCDNLSYQFHQLGEHLKNIGIKILEIDYSAITTLPNIESNMEQFSVLLVELRKIQYQHNLIFKAVEEGEAIELSNLSLEEQKLFKNQLVQIYSSFRNEIQNAHKSIDDEILKIEYTLDILKSKYKKYKEEEAFTSNLARSGLDDLLQVISSINSQIDSELLEYRQIEERSILLSERKDFICLNLESIKTKIKESESDLSLVRHAQLDFVPRLKELHCSIFAGIEPYIPDDLNQYLKEELTCINKTIASLETATDPVSDQIYTHQIAALKATLEFLLSSKDENMSQRGIDKLAELNSKQFKKRGFSYLLEILEWTSSSTSWDIYFKNQKLLATSLKIDKWLVLQERIKSKIIQYTNFLESKKLHLDFLNRIKNIKEECNDLVAPISDVMNRYSEIVLKLDTSKTLESELQKEYELILRELRTLEQSKASLTKQTDNKKELVGVNSI